MEWGKQMEKHQDNAKLSLYQNTNYSFERRERQTLIVEVTMGTSVHTFSVNLIEQLIIDKLSDIYLDSFTTFNTILNTADIKNSTIVLKINEFNIQSNIATNLNTTSTKQDSTKFNSIVIPNETSTAQTNIHKGKKMNYICSINPTKLSTISGQITDGGTSFDPPVYDTAFADAGRFIAEFVIVARDDNK